MRTLANLFAMTTALGWTLWTLVTLLVIVEFWVSYVYGRYECLVLCGIVEWLGSVVR